MPLTLDNISVGDLVPLHQYALNYEHSCGLIAQKYFQYCLYIKPHKIGLFAIPLSNIFVITKLLVCWKLNIVEILVSKIGCGLQHE